MAVVPLSLATLIFISLGDILFCNERRLLAERAPLYRSEFVLGFLSIFRLLQFPLMIWLGFVSWKVLIIVLVISFLGMRLFIDKTVEQIVLIPIINIIIRFFEKRNKHK